MPMLDTCFLQGKGFTGLRCAEKSPFADIRKIGKTGKTWEIVKRCFYREKFRE